MSKEKASKSVGTVEFHSESQPGRAGLKAKEGEGERDQPARDGNWKHGREYHKAVIIVN